MEAILLSAALIVAGLYFGFRNVRMLRSKEALRAYIQTSAKAAAWVNKYGVEGAMKMARETTIPFGIVVAIALVGAGVWNLMRMYF